MPVLENPIPKRAYELIGERIAEILADELPDQATKISDPYMAATVFRERIVPVDTSEVAEKGVVISMMSRAGYSDQLQTNLTKDGAYVYHIDAYVRADFTENQRGDTKAYVRLQRLLGLIQGIFQAPQYLTLGYNPGFIERRSIEDIQLAAPKDSEENDNMVFGRVILWVRAPDHPDPESVSIADGFDTQVKLYDTDFGYMYAVDNP